jgi:hypothetical protein
VENALDSEASFHGAFRSIYREEYRRFGESSREVRRNCRNDKQVINNYEVILYIGLGLTGSTPLLLYAVYNTVAAFMNWVNSMIIDRVGRVRLLTIGLVRNIEPTTASI